METIVAEKGMVFDGLFGSDHFGSALFTAITFKKLSRSILHSFDKKKLDKIAVCNGWQNSHSSNYASV